MKEPRLLLLTKYSVVLIRVRPFGDEEAVPGAEAVMPSHTKTGMVTSHSRLLMTLHPISVSCPAKWNISSRPILASGIERSGHLPCQVQPTNVACEVLEPPCP